MEMKSVEVSELQGKPLYSSEDHKVGEIDDVFLDDQTGTPEWVRIGVGLFGMKNVLVPLAPLSRSDGGLRAPYSKDMIKDAPSVDDSYVTPEQETSLYRYYGLTRTSPSELNEKRGAPGDRLKQGPPAFPESGEPPAFAGEEVIPEEAITPQREGEATRIRLRRWVQM